MATYLNKLIQQTARFTPMDRRQLYWVDPGAVIPALRELYWVDASAVIPALRELYWVDPGTVIPALAVLYCVDPIAVIPAFAELNRALQAANLLNNFSQSER